MDNNVNFIIFLLKRTTKLFLFCSLIFGIMFFIARYTDSLKEALNVFFTIVFFSILISVWIWTTWVDFRARESNKKLNRTYEQKYVKKS